MNSNSHDQSHEPNFEINGNFLEDSEANNDKQAKASFVHQSSVSAALTRDNMFIPKIISQGEYKKEDLVFVPLGGVGHIGMNLAIYMYRGKILVVDFGAGFAGDDMPGIEIIVPDISFLIERRKDLLGVVLTHVHEDHCGAIQHLWKDLGSPVIYATRFAKNFLEAKFAEYDLGLDVKVITPGQKVEISPFTIELVSLTHSIVENNGIFIKTEAGNVFHTGDWKFEENPVAGLPSDMKRLEEIGKEGVDAMVCDSTNIFVQSPRTNQEVVLREDLLKVVKEVEGIAAISMFASNVARIYTVSQIAKQSGRKLVLLGKSLWRIVEAAKKSGYLEGIEFLGDRDAKNLKPRELLLLCTGCQGEPTAASAKLAFNLNPIFRLGYGDAIIFSSKIIPGREKRIYKMFNQFVKSGVRVITEETHDVHVSGHPSRQELIRMYQLIKPQVAIPVHGEHLHLFEHCKLAQSLGVPTSLMIHNGDIIKLNKGGVGKIGEARVGHFGIEGAFRRDPEDEVMKARNRIAVNGVIVAMIILDRKHRLLKAPNLIGPGILNSVNNRAMIEEMAESIKQKIGDERNIHQIKKLTVDLVRDKIRALIDKKPQVYVQVEVV